MSDLKPCPFCGGEATHDTNGSEIWVICKKCGARCAGSFFSGKKGVRIVDERWNRRAPSAQPEIIRCKDCENYQTDWKPLLPDRHYCGVVDSMMKEDDFCSYAERRQDESEKL